MVWIVSLIYFLLGTVSFMKQVRLFSIASSVLLCLAFTYITDSPMLTGIYIAILLLSYIAMLIIKGDLSKKGTFYFSVPCWLLILSVLINVFVNP